MGAFMIAVYPDHAAAERARTELVARGFATDRVDLTSPEEAGQAGAMPAETPDGKLEEYFGKLFEGEEDAGRAPVQQLVEHLHRGGATITAHPRGDIEVEQAREILQRHQAGEIIEVGIESQSSLEHAAADRSAIMSTKG